MNKSDMTQGQLDFLNASKEYGLSEDLKPKDENSFFSLAKHLPKPPEDFNQNLKDFESSAVKGILEGARNFGRMFGPLQVDESESDQQKQFSESLDKLIPTQEETFSNRAIRSGMREIPTALSFPGSAVSTIPRALAAGFLGESGKELGLPEWAQTALQITAYIGPDITKKLLESGKTGEIVKKAKELGLTDEQIAPLMQSGFKQKWLTKLAPRRGKTERILKETKKGLDTSAKALQASESASQKIPKDVAEDLIKNLGEIGQDIPHEIRKIVNQDMLDFVKKPLTIKSTIQLYRKINKLYGKNTKDFGRFNLELRNAIKKTDPNFSEKFENLNNLYTRYFEIAPKLKPNLLSDVVRAAEALGLFGATLTGNTPFLTELLVEKGARIGARELLTNPRLQQLGQKFLQALNQNKYAAAHKVYQSMNDELKSLDKTLEMEKISEKDLRKLFKE